MADGSVVFETELDTDGLMTALDRLGYTVGSAIGNTLKIAGAAFGTLGTGAIGIISSSVSAVKELEQNIGGSEAVFKEHFSTIQAYGEDAFSLLGLSMSDYLATANKMGSLFQGSGFDETKSLEMTIAAMQRASDVASVMGIDVAWAMESIAGAAKGNFSMMDNLGVAMNATTLEAYALEKGLDVDIEKMATAEKVGLAMEMFLERTAYAAGRYAEENDTLAGSFQTLESAWENFKAGATESSVDDLIWSLDNYLNVLIANLEKIIPRLRETLPELVEKITPILSELLETVVPEVAPLIGSLFASIAPAIGEAMKAIAPHLIGGLIEGFTGSKETAERVKGFINSLFLPKEENPNNPYGDNYNRAKAAKETANWMSNQLSAFRDGIANGLSIWGKPFELLFGIGSAGAAELPASVSSASQEMANAVATDFQQAALAAFQAGEISYAELVAAAFPTDAEGGTATGEGDNAMAGLAQAMATDLSTGLEQQSGTVSGSVNTVIASAQSAADTGQFSSVGAQIAGGIAKGISNGTSVVVAAVKRLVEDALEAAKEAAEIRSPSRLFRDEIGAQISAGAAVGVESNAFLLRKAVNNMVAESTPDMRNIGKRAAALYAPRNENGMVESARMAAAGNWTQNNTFNVPVQTPDEFAKTMFMYATYGLDAEG